MDNLEISVERGSDASIAIIRLTGPVHLATLFAFQDALKGARESDTIIDVTNVPYIDSAGLGSILAHWTHTQGLGRKFGLTGANDRVKVLLELTQVHNILPQFKTPEDAERAFGRTS